jgi:hypothetical protein
MPLPQPLPQPLAGTRHPPNLADHTEPQPQWLRYEERQRRASKPPQPMHPSRPPASRAADPVVEVRGAPATSLKTSAAQAPNPTTRPRAVAPVVEVRGAPATSLDPRSAGTQTDHPPSGAPPGPAATTAGRACRNLRDRGRMPAQGPGDLGLARAGPCRASMRHRSRNDKLRDGSTSLGFTPPDSAPPLRARPTDTPTAAAAFSHEAVRPTCSQNSRCTASGNRGRPTRTTPSKGYVLRPPRDPSMPWLR